MTGVGRSLDGSSKIRLVRRHHLALLLTLLDMEWCIAAAGQTEQASGRAIFYEKLSGSAGTASHGRVSWSAKYLADCGVSVSASFDFDERAPDLALAMRGGHVQARPSLVIDVKLATAGDLIQTCTSGRDPRPRFQTH